MLKVIFPFQIRGDDYIQLCKYFNLLHQATEVDPMVYVKDTGERLLVIFRASLPCNGPII